MTTFLNLLPIVGFVGVPLLCAMIIARRMGRGMVVTNLPWALALLLSGAAALAVWTLAPAGNLSLDAVLMRGFSFGGYAALFVSLIVLAVVGVKRDRLAPAEAF